MSSRQHGNMLDYIEKYGNTPLHQLPLTEADQLVFCQLAYLPLDAIVCAGFEKRLTLQEAGRRFRLIHGDEVTLQNIPLLCNRMYDAKLLRLMAESRRFGELPVFGYRNELDTETRQQFSAVSVELPDKSVFVLFRGTDDTFTGWQEDFSMCFRSPVPSQEKALAYLLELAAANNCPLRIGGHSKGGNLSVYAATYCDKVIQARIKAIYNNDGPGFQSDIFQTSEYLRIREKVHTFLPQSSIIGMLFDHEEDYTIIQSHQMGFLQHDMYTWDIEKTSLIRLEQVTRSSSFVNKTVKNWLGTMDNEQREQFVTAIFETLDATAATTWMEFSGNILKSAGGAINHLISEHPETGRQLLGAVLSLVKCAAGGIELPRLPPLKRQRR